MQAIGHWLQVSFDIQRLFNKIKKINIYLLAFKLEWAKTGRAGSYGHSFFPRPD